jgi:hypothetical protein
MIMGINAPRSKRRFFHRNGIAAVEEVYLGRVLHGRKTTWHRNGRIASVECYQRGLLHGECRQWNENGDLLGSYRMKRGTGIQFDWYDDGQLHLEFSTVDGWFTGRKRSWYRDGKLASEVWLCENHDVSRAHYLKAAAAHPDWPRYPEEKRKPRVVPRQQFETRTFRLYCEWLISKSNTRDAIDWLKNGKPTTRKLGRLAFKRAIGLVSEAETLGAKQVLATDIYSSKSGTEFCDALVVRLPKNKNDRTAIRRLFNALPPRAHSVVQPDIDGGEKWLLTYFA